MKRILSAVLVILAVLPATGCNTIQGIGKDIERGGQAIERAANR